MAAEKAAAITDVKAMDPAEKLIRDQATKKYNWSHGQDADGTAHPFDVRENPDDHLMSLFADSMKVHDKGRMGTGYGTLTSNANPNFVASLDKENEMERDLAHRGALEGSVDREIEQNDRTMAGLADTGNQRNEFIAGLENQDSENAYNRALQQYLKPKQPGFMDRFGGAFADKLGAGLGSYAASGGGFAPTGGG